MCTRLVCLFTSVKNSLKMAITVSYFTVLYNCFASFFTTDYTFNSHNKCEIIGRLLIAVNILHAMQCVVS